MNFNNWKPRSHYMGLLMTDAAGKSNLELYNEADELYRQYKKEFEDMTDKQKDLKMGLKALEKYEAYLEKKKQLEPIKNIPNIGDTCRTKLREIYYGQKHGRIKVIENDYLTKGLEVEEDAITLYSLHSNQYHEKNTVLGENEWLTGTMDFDFEDTVLDTKASWDYWTFINSKYAKLNTLYRWQLDCYMWLFNKSKAKLVYCLVNTPEHLIRKEESRLIYTMFGSESNYSMASDGMIDAYKEGCAEIRKNHTFNDIPTNERVIVYETERDQSRIDMIKARIEYCRYYLNNFEELEKQKAS